jgi:hypothetical protein
MSDKKDFDSIDTAILADVSGGLSDSAMSKMVLSRANSNFGSRGAIEPVGKMKFGDNKSGFVLGRGKFDINSNWGGTERKSFNAVIDVRNHSVQHLQTNSLGWRN